MKYLVLLHLTLSLAGATAFADDGVRRLQEALRKRNLYFGEVDGRRNAEVTVALKRYQQRQGLPPTGEPSAPTLTSLGIAAPGKPGEEWPEGPVLRSDVARQISEEDRKFLEANSSSPPDPIAERPLPEVSPAAPPVVIAPEASPAAPPVVIAPESDPPPRRPKQAPVSPKPGATEENDAPLQLVRNYLAACETNHLSDEMRFYAPRVSYFDHGMVDTAFISKDVQRFYKRWPNRRYELLDCKVTPLKDGEWETRFRIGFHYTSDKGQAVSGRSLNIFKLQKSGEALHFISMKEQVVRE